MSDEVDHPDAEVVALTPRGIGGIFLGVGILGNLAYYVYTDGEDMLF